MVALADMFPREVVCTRTARLPVPAATAWVVVGDLANEVVGSGMIDRVDVVGEGEGALRTFHLPGGARVIERIEEYDSEAFRYVYRIIDAGPLPMARYLGLAALSAAGDVGCLLSWSAMADPVDGDAASLTAMLDANVTHAVNAIARHFGADP